MQRKTLIRKALALCIAIFTFVVYLPDLRNGFIRRDDIPYIVANTHIRSLNLSFWKWAFSSFYSANWHPFTWVSHALDYAIWGLNPLGHHLTSIFLHTVNTYIVVILIFKLYDASERMPLSVAGHNRKSLIAAGVTGLLFGLHPMHVESVAWAAERKDLLCALFFLLSVTVYIDYAQTMNQQSKGNLISRCRYFEISYLGSLVFFTLALLSKPMAVSLPFVLLILDWYPLARIVFPRDWGKMVGEKLPFLALSVAASIVTIFAQQSGLAMEFMGTIPLSTRVLVAFNSLVAYLWKMLWPVNLFPFYLYPKEVGLQYVKYIYSIVLVIGTTALFVARAKWERFWLSIWCYYVVTLLPVLGIVQIGEQSMADRYIYLPGIAPILAVSVASAWLYSKFDHQPLAVPSAKIFSWAALMAILIFLTILTVRQIGVWKNDITLWTSVIEKSQEPVPLAYTTRSMAYFDSQQYEKAIDDFTVIISFNPRSFPAFFYRGIANYKVGQLDHSISDFTTAIDIDPNASQCYFSRGVALLKKGKTRLAKEDFVKACGMGYEQACTIVNLR